MAKIDRHRVHAKYNGHCSYCGKVISIKDMQVDHIVPKRQGGSDHLINLNPSCRRCNHYKRAYRLDRYRELSAKLHLKVQGMYLCKTAEDYGIIKVDPWDGKFYFEKHGEADQLG